MPQAITSIVDFRAQFLLLKGTALKLLDRADDALQLLHQIDQIKDSVAQVGVVRRFLGTPRRVRSCPVCADLHRWRTGTVSGCCRFRNGTPSRSATTRLAKSCTSRIACPKPSSRSTTSQPSEATMTYASSVLARATRRGDTCALMPSAPPTHTHSPSSCGAHGAQQFSDVLRNRIRLCIAHINKEAAERAKAVV